MSYQTQTIQNTIKQLNRSWFLPSIQRPFVWDVDNIIKLFDSLMRGYPISTFLLWEIEEKTKEDWQTYKFIPNFKSGDVHNDLVDLQGSNNMLVLDGQQRLTSLLIGLAGSYTVKKKYARKQNADAWNRQVLFLDLMKIPNEVVDESTENLDIAYGFKFFEERPRQTADHYWFRVSDIFPIETDDQFGVFNTKIIDELAIGATRFERQNVERTLERLYRVVHCDEIIASYVEKKQSLDHVLNIFIRANDGGSKLTKSDLLLSTVTAKWRSTNAREEVFNFVDFLNDQMPRKNRVTKDYVLKSALVLCDLEVAYKIDNFTQANLEKMEENWPVIRQTLEATMRFVNGFGYGWPEIPSLNALIPISYYIFKTKAVPSGTTSNETRDRRAIHQFLTGALLFGAFSGTSDNAISVCRGAIKDSLRQENQFPLRGLVNALARQGRSASLNTENIQRYFDIRYGGRSVPLALSMIYDRPQSGNWDVDVDHIIPKSSFDEEQLRLAGHTENQIADIGDCIHRLGNLQILLARENNEKRATPFRHWIETRDDSFLATHCLPIDRSLWSVENLPAFVRERERLMAARIKNSSPALVSN